MSAAGTAAGFLYASGRLSSAVRARIREAKLTELEQSFLAKNVKPSRARELALEALAAAEIPKGAT